MTFETIYQAYWNKIYRLCMGFVNDHELARDLTQETFLTVWQKLSAFRNESAISTWIFRIASNHCLRQMENHKRAPRTNRPDELEDRSEPSNDHRIRLLYKCISEPGEMDRIIISLELEDIRQAEIAEITGISESHVRVKIHRIREKLTKKFKQYE